MKLSSFFLPVLTALASNCVAATVNVGGAGDRGLWQSDSGSAVAAGSKVWVGYFLGLTDASVISNQHNTSFLQSKFISFGLGGAVGDGVAGADGYFTFDTNATVSAPGASFAIPSTPNNQQIYVWAFDSGVAPSFASHQAIFTSAAPNWTWPVGDDGFSDRSISPDNALTILVGSADSSHVYLQSMPEPGSCALIAIGVVGLLGARPSIKRSRLITAGL